MADVIFVAIIVAFTALCIAYIAWCDRIIGPDEPDNASGDVARAEQQEPVTL